MSGLGPDIHVFLHSQLQRRGWRAFAAISLDGPRLPAHHKGPLALHCCTSTCAGNDEVLGDQLEARIVAVQQQGA